MIRPVLAALCCLAPLNTHAQTLGWECRRKCVDAGINWDDKKRYLFKGDQYIAFSGDEPEDYYPKPIAGNWQFPSGWSSGIDAAVNWGNGTIYIFKDGQYLRYDIVGDGKASAPRPIAGNWGFPASWSSGIDAGINWGDGKIYFFKGSEYLRYDVAAEAVDDGFPRPIAGNWPGFPASWSSGIDSAVNWGNGTIYLFKDGQYLRYDVGAGGKFGHSEVRAVPGNWSVYAEAPRADLNKAYVTLPVTVQGLTGESRTGKTFVTYYRPNGPGPFPTVIYSHGRRPNNRAFPQRRREMDQAIPWLKRGFAFFIATRLGYGGTGLDPDVEESNGCVNAQYAPATKAVVAQALAS
jgi:hypothetical protein